MHERGRTPSPRGAVECRNEPDRKISAFTGLVREGCLEPDGSLTEKARAVLQPDDYDRIFCDFKDVAGEHNGDFLGDFIYDFDPGSGVVFGSGPDGFRVIRDPRIANLVASFETYQRQARRGFERSQPIDDEEEPRLPLRYPLGGAAAGLAVAGMCRLTGIQYSQSIDGMLPEIISISIGSFIGLGAWCGRAMREAAHRPPCECPPQKRERWLQDIAKLLDDATPLAEIKLESDPLPDRGKEESVEDLLHRGLYGREPESLAARRRENFFADVRERANELGARMGARRIPSGNEAHDIFKNLVRGGKALAQNDPRYMPALIELLEARQRALDAYNDIKARVRAAQARQRQGVTLRADKKLLKRGLSDENANNPFGKDEMGEVNRAYQQAWLKFIDTYAHVQHSYHFNQLRAGIAEMLPPVAEEASPYEFPVVRVIWDELSNAMSEITEPTRENVALLGDIKDTIATLPKTLPFAELYELYEKIYYKFAPRLRTLMTPSEFRRTYPGVADGVV